MLRVIRTDRLPRLLPLHVVRVPLDAVLSAEGFEAVGAADQQPACSEGHQHADVVLAAFLERETGSDIGQIQRDQVESLERCRILCCYILLNASVPATCYTA